jgi:hypothetical protein
MAHLFTVRVPPEYRCAGRGYVGLSVFQAGDGARGVGGVPRALRGGAVPAHRESADAFWAAVAAHAHGRHPRERYMRDRKRSGWALIWLDEGEFTGPCCPVPDAAAQLPRPADDGGTDPYRCDQPPQALSVLVRQGDPNVGRRMGCNADPAYVPEFSPEWEARGLPDFPVCHFGGTAAYPVGGEPNFGPRYLQFDETLGGGSLECGGSVLIDLRSSRLHRSG